MSRSELLLDRRAGLAGAFSFAALGSGSPALGATACAALAGRWGGTLVAGPTRLRLVLEVADDGSATLVSVDQGGSRIPAAGATCAGDDAAFDFPAVNGRLTVRRTAEGALDGTWTQGGPLPLRLTRLADGAAPAPAPPPEPIGAIDEELARALAVSGGAAFGVSWRGPDTSGASAAGSRNAGRAADVTHADIWHVGSITKAMTGTLFARLAERGLVAWDEPLGDAFATIAPDMNPAYRAATPSDLMHGLSGLPTNVPMPLLVGFPREEVDPRASRIRYARAALAMAPEAARGARFIYPNNGFTLIGALIEARTGKSWEEAIRAEVFAPLRLESAGFGPPPIGSRAAPTAPVGLVRPDPRRPARPTPAGVPQDNPAVLGPAGRVHMTLSDLVRFGQAHAAGLSGGPRPAFVPEGYLAAETWRRLHAPPPGSSYAIGWVRRPDGSSWHNGSNTLFYAELLVDPRAGTVIAAATNLASAEREVARLIAAGRATASRAA